MAARNRPKGRSKRKSAGRSTRKSNAGSRARSGGPHIAPYTAPPPAPSTTPRTDMEVEIESLAAGGDGVSRLDDGRAVFVVGVAPGDRVSIRILESRKRFARAEVVRVIAPGPGRTTPRCEHFGRCGGCTWQHIDYPTQLAAKNRILSDALTRIGGCPEFGELPFHPSPDAYSYRGRARLLGRGGRLGYREAGSHRLCPVTDCPILIEPLRAEFERLSERLRQGAERSASTSKRAARRARAREGDVEWEIRVGSDGETRASQVGADEDTTEPITLKAGDDRLKISPGTFAQANTLLLDSLWRAVQRAVGTGESLWELYAGAGFFTLGFARGWARVRAVEVGAAAVRDLRANLALASIGNVEIVAARVESALAGEAAPPEAVFLDPPRAGLEGDAVRELARLGARRIVYLSCDPATLARDIAQLREAGYEVVAAEGFDLFPQTPHVEALVCLELQGSGDGA